MNEQATLASGNTVKFANDKYPILSFLYAVYAGGEHEMNCFERNDFMDAYLSSDAGKDVQEFIRTWFAPRENESPPPQPTGPQWDLVLRLLKQELQQPDSPSPMW